MPTGMIISFAGSVAPDGWLMCDGSAISQTTYSKLFSVVGHTYGMSIDDDALFLLPDLRGRNVIGTSNSYPLAQKQGSESVTLSVTNLPSHNHTCTTDSNGSHNHTASDSGHQHGYVDGYYAEAYAGGPRGYYGSNAGADQDNAVYERNMTSSSSTANISVQSAGSHTHSFTTSSVGSASSFSVVQPYVAIHYLIKYIQCLYI